MHTQSTISLNTCFTFGTRDRLRALGAYLVWVLVASHLMLQGSTFLEQFKAKLAFGGDFKFADPFTREAVDDQV